MDPIFSTMYVLNKFIGGNNFGVKEPYFGGIFWYS